MNSQQKSGLMIAAPSSGSGKTLVTLALLRAFKNREIAVASAKAGPDYIDPGFHEIASGAPSVNLDPWAMAGDRLKFLANSQPGTHLLVEAMMGLYDGAVDGTGSAANLAKTLGIPVLLVVDAARQSHSIAALVRGFRDHDPELELAGVILNKIGSSGHVVMLSEALSQIDVRVFGAIPRNDKLVLPERHLGLVQAGETAGVEAFIQGAAEVIEASCDLDDLVSVLDPVSVSSSQPQGLPPIGQRIAIARDEAFSFIYPHLLSDWRHAGAEISFFSPLNDEAPKPDSDAVYLPGGYPELHGGRLSGADTFKSGLFAEQDRGAVIYGECGGYMVLGEGIVDAEGNCHTMTGLLKLETSFEKRKLHLGYRNLEADGFAMGNSFAAHEFHYTSALRETGEPLFSATDARGNDLGTAGLRDGTVMGSYMHIIDRRP